MKLRSLALILTSILLSSCSTMTTIPRFPVHVTLPASEDGFFVNTVRLHDGTDEGTVPKAQWLEMRKRGLVLLPPAWFKLRSFLLENCLTNSCKLMVGTFDTLFKTIDDALSKLPAIPVPGVKP